MMLLIRTFMAEPGQGAELTRALQGAATRIIQSTQADSVLLCQQSDVPERVFWIESSRSGAAGRGADALRGLPVQALAARSLHFIEGFYRFPMPACRVWSLEVRAAANGRSRAVRGLVRLARSAPEDLNVAGLSVYRDVNDSSSFVAFVALLPDVPPERYLGPQLGPRSDVCGADPARAWLPLSVTWTMGRLSAPGGWLLSPTRYPSTAFWARSGRPRGGAGGAEPRSGVGHPNRQTSG